MGSPFEGGRGMFILKGDVSDDLNLALEAV